MSFLIFYGCCFSAVLVFSSVDTFVLVNRLNWDRQQYRSDRLTEKHTTTAYTVLA